MESRQKKPSIAAPLEDELKKLGLRVRARKTEPRAQDGDKPGHIAFDDRGNAVYEWNDDRLSADGEDGEQARRRALEHPGLTVVDDEPAANAPIRTNKNGVRIGYNPYESGLLSRKERPKKRDLRELSKWVQLKKNTGRESD
jgi:hypothetical protein